MQIRRAEAGDLSGWRNVADDVAVIFGNPQMANDTEFIDYAQRKISQGEAIAAYDEETGRCAGVIGFSRHHNRITWLGVLEEYRNRGIGSGLLKAALDELDSSRDITVDTYRGDYIPGLPARHLYIKYGFVEVDDALYDHLGNERSKFVVPSKQKKEG